MIAEKLLCHASGDFSKPFILGFYLYYIVQDKDGQRGEFYHKMIIIMNVLDLKIDECI